MYYTIFFDIISLQMKIDLHIHSCLSPCADLEMSPSEIVNKAKASGLEGIALTDHQTAKNCPAAAVCAGNANLPCLYGLEVQTSEEVHTLSIFDTLEQALEMTQWVYERMPKRVNDPDTFGDQPVVTWDNDIVEIEWRILAMSTQRSIPETSVKTRELGGIYIAAHVDRPNFSVLGTLGAIPENYFDAVELSRTADETLFARHISPYAVVRSSDSHNLDDIGKVWTEVEATELSVAALKDAFDRKATRISPRLTAF